MSDGLWRDALDCGCAKGGGHSCRVPWMTEEEWRGATAEGREGLDSLVGLQRIGRGEGTGNTNAPNPQCSILSEQDSAT